MGIAMFWAVVGTLLVVGVVTSVAGRRRRRQQLARLYEHVGSVDAVRAATRSQDVERGWRGFAS